VQHHFPIQQMNERKTYDIKPMSAQVSLSEVS
jgi:hypothetical protein